MSFLDVDRFHRAAREGHLDLLQEGNRKELNSQDEDGMTPAMWAAYYGNLDALRLIVGRGGDPDKSDHYGNTPLHCASGNGHINCVSFLVNFGVNMWALDNDFHTAKDVAVLNRRDEVLRILDQAQSKHALVNKKLVQRLKEKSVADAEKRIKSYRKLQLKAVRRAEKEEKILERQRRKFLLVTNGDSMKECRMAAFRRDSRYLYAPKFSDIVHGLDKKVHGAVSKKVGHQRKKGVEFRLPEVIEAGQHSPVNYDSSSDDHSHDADENEDGSPPPLPPRLRDVRNSDPDEDDDDDNSDVHHTADSGIGDELPNTTDSSSFERSRFGNVTFRSSTISLPTSDDITLVEKDISDITESPEISKVKEIPNVSKILRHCHRNNDSIGSASSLVRRHISWNDENDHEEGEIDEIRGDEQDDDLEDEDPVVLFLSALGLFEYTPLFQAEKIDLESLSLLTEEDLKTLGMPLGPRRKLEKALERRRFVFEEPGTVQDSKL